MTDLTIDDPPPGDDDDFDSPFLFGEDPPARQPAREPAPAPPPAPEPPPAAEPPPPAVESAGAGDEAPDDIDVDSDDWEDDWSFDAADIEPETETLGEAIDASELARLGESRKQEQMLEKQRKRQVEKAIDEEGRQRRQNVRVQVQYPVTVRIAGHPGAQVRTRDLSATGVGFATRLPLEVEESGTVTIHFPEWNFTKEIVVRFVKPILAGKQVGAQFTKLTADERERIVKEVFAVQRAQLQAQRAAPGR